MDLAKTLIRSVVRAFYETRHCLVIDALMVHSALPNEDLALLLGMQQKDLRRLCGRLKEDRLLAVHSRQETREGMQRPVHRDYYYVDFHATIDAIKYRISHLERKVKDLYKPSTEKKDYYCPRCKSEWTQMEVLDSINPMTGEFSCHKCNGTLERHETSAADRAGHERQSKLMGQIDKLLKLLRQIDATDVPQNDFQTALSLQVPIIRDESINPSRNLAPLKPMAPVTVKGTNADAAAPVEVSLVDADEREAARKEAARKQEEQNALPEWYTKSTVTGDKTALGLKEASRQAALGESAPLVKSDEDKKGNETVNAAVDEYFKELKEEQAREAQERASSEEEDEDDDEDDDFEDVVGVGGSGNGSSAVITPSSSVSGLANGVDAHANGGRPRSSLGKAEDESGSSAPGTNVPTPQAYDANASPSKRVKLDPDTAKEAAKEEDSDEDEEFEDAL